MKKIIEEITSEYICIRCRSPIKEKNDYCLDCKRDGFITLTERIEETYVSARKQ